MSSIPSAVGARTTFRNTCIAASAVCVMVVVPVAQAEIVVDDFSTGDFFEVISSGLSSSEQTGSMIGGVRFAGQAVSGNPFDNDLSTSVSGGEYRSLAGEGLVGLGLLGWGLGTETGGPLDLDLGGDTAFEIRFGDALGHDVNFTLGVGTQGSGADLQPFVVAAGSTSAIIDISGFTEVDLGDVDFLSLDFNVGSDGVAGLELSIDRLAFIPAPGAIALFGLAGIGAGCRRRD